MIFGSENRLNRLFRDLRSLSIQSASLPPRSSIIGWLFSFDLFMFCFKVSSCWWCCSWILCAFLWFFFFKKCWWVHVLLDGERCWGWILLRFLFDRLVHVAIGFVGVGIFSWNHLLILVSCLINLGNLVVVWSIE